MRSAKWLWYSSLSSVKYLGLFFSKEWCKVACLYESVLHSPSLTEGLVASLILPIGAGGMWEEGEERGISPAWSASESSSISPVYSQMKLPAARGLVERTPHPRPLVLKT